MWFSLAHWVPRYHLQYWLTDSLSLPLAILTHWQSLPTTCNVDSLTVSRYHLQRWLTDSLSLPLAMLTHWQSVATTFKFDSLTVSPYHLQCWLTDNLSLPLAMLTHWQSLPTTCNVDSLTVSPYHLQHQTVISITVSYNKDKINLSSHHNNSDNLSDYTKFTITSIALSINTVSMRTPYFHLEI